MTKANQEKKLIKIAMVLDLKSLISNGRRRKRAGVDDEHCRRAERRQHTQAGGFEHLGWFQIPSPLLSGARPRRFRPQETRARMLFSSLL